MAGRTMYDLNGKVAIITGGASGMGRAATLLFARAGAHVVLADLNVAGGEEVARLASETGNEALFQRTDVSNEADVAALVARATKRFGRLDIMFNNAGIGGAVGPLEGITRRRLGPHTGGVPARRISRYQARRRADSRGRRRFDHFDGVDRGHPGLSEPACVQRGQSRRRQPDALRGARIRV